MNNNNLIATPTITDAEMVSLMQAIKNRYGLDFTHYEKSSLKRGLSRLMMKHGMESLWELWSRILKDQEFFSKAIDDLLVNLTELFRNPDVWVNIRDNVLSEFNSKPLKIWHAGCSTGEEVYTMAIVLNEKNYLYRTNTLATDLSTKALNAAIKGSYSTLLLNQYLRPFLECLPGRRMEDYFDFSDNHACIKNQYKQHVRYKKHNLVSEPAEDKYDIIFCRNVMIYFDERLKGEVLNLFFNSLNDGGFLVIGYYDIMPEAGKSMFDIYDMKTRIYRKSEIQ